MVRPRSLSIKRLRRKRVGQVNAIQESGARIVGRTKGGTPIYGPPTRGYFKAVDLEIGIEREAHFRFGISKKKAKRLVGI